jgi:hypothetical protein
MIQPAAPRASGARGALVRKGLFLAVVILPFVLLLTACPPLENGVTVSGTVSGWYFGITGPATVTASRSGTDITTQVTLTGSSLESGPYSVANVPPGDYTFVITFSSGTSTTGTSTLAPNYSIDGGAAVAADSDPVPVSGPPYTHTITFIGVPINHTEKIDLYLGSTGG